MKRGRTKRRVARTRFEEKFCEIAVDAPDGDFFYFMKVSAKVLGEWGYHGDLWNIEKTQRIWTVFHVASGFKIWSCSEEKEAKIACKRLHHKIERHWELTKEERRHFHCWCSKVFNITNKHMRSGEDISAILRREKITPSQYYDDIPF